MDDLDFLQTTATSTPEIIDTQENITNEYITLGYGIFKLEGKKPLIKEWQKQTPSNSKVIHNGNYGVCLQDRDLIIDVDPRNGGDKSFMKLLEDLKIPYVTDTFVVLTGGGGLHVYLRKPPGMKISKKHNDYPGIEFLSEGCYVVGVNSIHPDTKKPYTIQNGNLTSIKDAPAELLELLRKNKVLVKANELEGVEKKKRFSEYLINLAPLAIQGDQGDFVTYKVACKAKDLGLSKEQAFDCMLINWNDRCEPPWSDTDLRIKIENAYRYGINPLGADTAIAQFDEYHEADPNFFKVGNWKYDNKGKLKPNNLNNIVQYLLNTPELNNLVRLNEFTGHIEFCKIAPWHIDGFKTLWFSQDEVFLKYYLEEKFEYTVTNDKLFEQAIDIVAQANKYHPVKKWLEALKWDGKPRIKTWLADYCGARVSKFTQEAGLKTLTGAIHRIYNPGCQFDYVLILEGDQGIGKSTLVNILGHQWASSGFIDFTNKDTVDLLRGKWIIELAEMDALNKSESTAAKAFITRRTDRARLAYRKDTKDYPRQCIFIGTINPGVEGYLKDITGNRRFWPVTCTEINTKALQKDVEQLWAEALVYCKEHAGDVYIQDKEAITEAEEEQRQRVQSDAWEECTIKYLNDNKKHKITITELWSNAFYESPSSLSMLNQKRIASCLKKLGWIKQHGREGNYWLHEDYNFSFLL